MTVTHLSKSSLRWLTQRVVEQVKLAGTTYQDVMKSYSPTPIAWAVLPPVVDIFKRRFFLAPPAVRVGSLEQLHAVYLRTLRALETCPWTPGLLEKASMWFDRQVFSDLGNHPQRREIFAAEFAMHMADSPTRLILSHNSAFTRCRAKGYVAVFGIFNGTLEGGQCDAKAGVRWLTESAANRTHDTFDVLDKLVMQPIADDVYQACKLLKIMGGPETAYEIEQQLWKIPALGAKETSLTSLKYSKDMWKTVEMVWTDPTRDPALNYAELFDVLVPDYMSESYFQSIFPDEYDYAKVVQGMVRVKKLFEDHWDVS